MDAAVVELTGRDGLAVALRENGQQGAAFATNIFEYVSES